jgi:subtilisin family serine protease
MGKNRMLLLVSILFIFFFTSNFDLARFPEEKIDKIFPDGQRISRKNISSINSGQPFRIGEKRYAEDQVLVKFKPVVSKLSREITINAYQAKTIDRIEKAGVVVLQIPEYLTVEEMLWVLEQNPEVEHATPNYITYIASVPRPNDRFFDYQYSLFNQGQDIGIPGSPHGSQRADIKALEGWEESKGEKDVIIAILDSGIDFGHSDLMGKIASVGYDFANEDNDPADDNGHGTHIAGIAAAETDNQEGIAGVAWNCKILPLKIVDEDGTGYLSWLIDAIYYAVDTGAGNGPTGEPQSADVINMSLGFELGPNESVPELEAALQYAKAKGAVCVASAGNETSSIIYPAAYDDYCLAVAATDYNDTRPSWSNFGPEMDVAAPGVRIVSCVPTGYWGEGSLPYGFLGGTSTAAPHVAGLAALIKSVKPWLSPDEIMKIIQYSADDTNVSTYPGKDEFIGYGRINMEKALVPIKITGSQ